MDHHSVAYVGFDPSKTKHAVAVAEGGREGEVRYLGEIEATPAAVERLLGKLAHKYKTLHVCYEAGPTGYGLYRHIRALGHACDVIAPSLVPTARAIASRPTGATRSPWRACSERAN